MWAGGRVCVYVFMHPNKVHCLQSHLSKTNLSLHCFQADFLNPKCGESIHDFLKKLIKYTLTACFSMARKTIHNLVPAHLKSSRSLLPLDTSCSDQATVCTPPQLYMCLCHCQNILLPSTHSKLSSKTLLRCHLFQEAFSPS